MVVCPAGCGIMVTLYHSLFYFFSVISPYLPDVKGSLYQFYVFSRGNYSICNCRFIMSMGGSEFKIFLHHHLKLKPQDIFLISGLISFLTHWLFKTMLSNFHFLNFLVVL